MNLALTSSARSGDMYDDWLYTQRLKAVEGENYTLHVDRKGNALRAQCGDDKSMREVCQHRSLAKLSLYATEVTDEGFAAIENLQELRILDMGGNNRYITGKALAVLPKLKKLEVLGCNPEKDRELAFEHIGKCSSLIMLELSSVKGFPGKSLEHLTKLKNLRDLRISQNPITDDDLPFIQQLPNLQIISCACPKLSDRACDILAQCPNLEEITLGDTQMTGEGLKSLSRLKHLRHLLISDTKVSGPGLAALADFPALDDLSLWGLPIDDSHVELLLRCKRLKSLDICHTKITKVGAKRLLLNLKLRMLHMDEEIRAQLRDEGVVED